MEKLKQNSIVDLTQFGTNNWEKHNTFWQGNKVLEIMTLV